MMKLWRCSKDQNKSIQVRNLKIPYRVEHRDVKHPRIEVKPDKDVLVILPPDASSPEELLEEHKGWVQEKISTIDEMISELGLDDEEIEEKLILFGDAYNLKLEDGAYDISIENGSVEVSAPRDVDGLVHFRNWLREELRDKLTDFSEALASEVEVEYNKLYIRSQKTKWASCSSKGNLSFNLRAAILPRELMKHLVLHELIHLKKSKHDKEFWKLIGRYHPDYEEKEESLVRYWFLAHKNKPWNKIIGK